MNRVLVEVGKSIKNVVEHKRWLVEGVGNPDQSGAKGEVNY